MKENTVIIITMIINLIVAIMKITLGIIFSFSTLIADSIQSFIDFVTDITSLIANKIGKRRANNTYPFGYGQVYYLANLFTGALLFLIGIFMPLGTGNIGTIYVFTKNKLLSYNIAKYERSLFYE